MTANQLRSKYLDFFKSKGHTIIPSASLIPQNDASVLFTTAGMHPLVPYLLGQQHPGGTRVADSQKCVRTTDIDEVGDNRHLTFFEMLGNWSFGDYFKEEAIAWSFEFLTSEEWLNISPKNLSVTVFKGDDDVTRDDQAIEAWKKAFRSHKSNSIAAEAQNDIYNFGGLNKIFPYGRDKNWWQAGDIGPAGPDTEMFVDTEGDLPDEMRVKHKHWQAETGETVKCHVNCDCGRFIEIWNDVFMQYNGVGGGKYEPLSQKNVDTGMGLERVVAFLDGQQSVYDTDLFSGAFDIIAQQIGVSTAEQERKQRIITDHLRAAVFMVSDGAIPSNKERGYILRRILRRAFAHGKMLGLSGEWVRQIISHYIEFYSEAYPDLKTNNNLILEVILGEEMKFAKTLEEGFKVLDDHIKSVGKSMQKMDDKPSWNFDAATAFKLFESYGMPVEITKEILKSQGIPWTADFDSEFNNLLSSHKDNSRTAAAGMFKGGLADHNPRTIRMHTATHLMQAALRKVLGDHVFQKGSNVTSERTRFDFTHNEKMAPEQLAEVERLVNEAIAKDMKVQHDEMTPDQARAEGALGVFGEKYGDIVSIYTIADADGIVFSREFCGGPHVNHTGEIGGFKIQKEEAVSAGVRRIKATIIDA
jgi:alanyl-tRNA synthetase